MVQSDAREKIYLAGGFRSGWQAKVKEEVLCYEFLDPSQHNIQDPAAYTRWNLDAIRASNAVLGYMKSTNPGGYLLALEIGFAHALGKTVTQYRTAWFAIKIQSVGYRKEGACLARDPFTVN